MSPEEILSLLRLLTALPLLLLASYSDWKYRLVKDIVWISLGLIGFLFLGFQLILLNSRCEYFLIFLPTAVLFADTFIERGALLDLKKKKLNFPWVFFYLLSVFAVIFLIFRFGDKTDFLQLLTVPIMLCIIYGMYFLNLLQGGADAKSLISITILVPFYPSFFGFPLINLPLREPAVVSIILPFSLLVLFNAVILMVFLPLAFFIFNAVRGDFRLPLMFAGYRMKITDVANKHIWLMERFVDGERRTSIFPQRDERKKDVKETLDRLKKVGEDTVWVTPKVPFIIPISIGFIASFLLGNIFFWIIGVLLHL